MKGKIMAIYQEASLKAEYLTAKKEAASRGTQRITSWEALKHAMECVPQEQRYRAYLVAAATFVYLHQS